MPGKGRLSALTSAALIACTVPTVAAAEVRLSGTTDQLVVEARNATMPEILAGVESTLHTRIVLHGAVDRRFTGTYAGSLRRVLTRLLDGVDYVVSPDRDQISIVLLGADGSRSAARVAQGGSASQLAIDSHIQGWAGVPSELPPRMLPAVGASVAAAALPDSNFQGWTGVPSELPPRVLPAVGVSVAGAALPDSDIQGWTGQPSELPKRAGAPREGGRPID